MAIAPAASPGDVQAAVESAPPTASAEEFVVAAGSKLGVGFYKTRASAAELSRLPHLLPALRLGESPAWVPKSAASKQDAGPTEDSSHVDSSEYEFLVPSPRFQLGAIVGKSQVRRLLAYLAGERPLVRAVVIYAVFIELLSLGVPLTVQVLINTISFGVVTQQLLLLSILLLLALAGAAVLRVLQMYMIEQLSRRFMKHVVTDYAARLAAVQSARNYQPVHRFFEVAAVDKAFFVLGIDFLTLVLQIVAASVLLAFYHPILLSFTLVMVVSSWLVVRLPFSRGVARKIEESNAKYSLAAFLEGDVSDDVTQMTRLATWLEARRRAFRISIGQQIGLFVIQVSLSVALLLLGGDLVIQGELTLGQLVAAELVAGTTLISLSQLGKQLPKIYDLVTSFEKLGKITDLSFDGLSPPPVSSIAPRKWPGGTKK